MKDIFIDFEYDEKTDIYKLSGKYIELFNIDLYKHEDSAGLILGLIQLFGQIKKEVEK